MIAELKSMLEGLNTEELKEVNEIVTDLIAIDDEREVSDDEITETKAPGDEMIPFETEED